MNITVLTPTFNRAYILNKLYSSLINQTFSNFEWLIIDDGSSDNTEELVEEWKTENKIKIRYYKKENGGKHRALNFGIKKIKNELTFIVDSDDYLTEDAIETITYYYNKYKENKNLSGYSFLRGYPNGEVNGEKFKENELIDSFINCRLKHNVKGDKSEVYFTSILKKYPFLEIPNEKFLFEDYVWIQIGAKYEMVHINKIIYIGEYLEDGLTKNMMKVKVGSPKGMSERGLILCSKECNLKTRIKGIIHYTSYGLLSGEKSHFLFKKCKYKLLFILFYLFSILYYIKLLKYKRSEAK